MALAPVAGPLVADGSIAGTDDTSLIPGLETIDFDEMIARIMAKRKDHLEQNAQLIYKNMDLNIEIVASLNSAIKTKLEEKAPITGTTAEDQKARDTIDNAVKDLQARAEALGTVGQMQMLSMQKVGGWIVEAMDAITTWFKKISDSKAKTIQNS